LHGTYRRSAAPAWACLAGLRLQREINALGDGAVYVYDANGNLAQKTDADGYVTAYGYDPRNLAEAISYSDGKSAAFAYYGNGELVAMDDWNGHTSFTLDLLGQLEITGGNFR
jgi:uncharacterized protein RhaS with RHS repeats